VKIESLNQTLSLPYYIVVVSTATQIYAQLFTRSDVPALVRDIKVMKENGYDGTTERITHSTSRSMRNNGLNCESFTRVSFAHDTVFYIYGMFHHPACSHVAFFNNGNLRPWNKETLNSAGLIVASNANGTFGVADGLPVARKLRI